MKHLRVSFSGPPTADIASFVSMSDDQGNDLSGIGTWEHNGIFWEYVIPIELVPRIVIPDRAPDLTNTLQEIVDRRTAELEKSDPRADARNRLRERAAAVRLTKATTPPAQQTAADVCPNCASALNPATDTLLECPACHEQRCTLVCMPSQHDPCLDCRALGRTVDDDMPAALEGANEPDQFGHGLFDGKQVHSSAGREVRAIRPTRDGVPPPPDYDDDGADVVEFDDVTGGGTDGPRGTRG